MNMENKMKKELVASFTNRIGKPVEVRMNSQKELLFYENGQVIGKGPLQLVDPEDVIVGYIGNIPLNTRMVNSIGQGIVSVKPFNEETLKKLKEDTHGYRNF